MVAQSSPIVSSVISGQRNMFKLFEFMKRNNLDHAYCSRSADFSADQHERA
jgi:hypothetical protein